MAEQLIVPRFTRDYDEVDVFYNPGSTVGMPTYRHVRERLGDRIEVPGKSLRVRYFETSREAEDTEATIREEVDPDKPTIVMGVCGDGTNRQFFQFLPESGYDNVAFGTFGGGSGGNVYKSTISKDYRSYPDYVIEDGHVVPFRLIQCAFTLPDNSKHDLYAASIVSSGVVRDMIYPVNHESHRNRKIRSLHFGRHAVGKYIVDPPEMLGGFFRAQKFETQEEDGTISEAIERAYIHTPSIAEIVYAPEAQVTGPIHKLLIPDRLAVLKALQQLRKGNSPGADLTEPDTFKTVSDLPFQVDGDDSIDDRRLPFQTAEDKDGNKRCLLIWPAGTTVTIKQSDRPIPLVTTMP